MSAAASAESVAARFKREIEQVEAGVRTVPRLRLGWPWVTQTN
jgi:hypothetical protein